jgi:DNA mismatch repair ATPase MutL
VLYEQALEDLKRGRAASQQLLFPIVLELTATEKAVIESPGSIFSHSALKLRILAGRRYRFPLFRLFSKTGQ